MFKGTLAVLSDSLGWFKLAAGCCSGRYNQHSLWNLSVSRHVNSKSVGGKPALVMLPSFCMWVRATESIHSFSEQGVAAPSPKHGVSAFW